MTKKKKPAKSPAFQFYPSNFLGSPKVRVMNAEEVGVYWLLCCIEWEHDGFTLEDAQECAESVKVSPARFGKIWGKLSRSFVTRGNRFFSPRLDKERDKQKAWRRKSSKGGKLGMAKRWGKEDKGGNGMVIPPDNTPFLSPSPTPVTTTTAPVEKQQDQVFEEAWSAYPKRPGNSKIASWRQWVARVKAGDDPLDMLAGARAYARHCERERAEPKHIKMAQTFFGRDRHFASDWGPVAGPDPTPAEVFAKVLGVPVERIKALWAEEDHGLSVARRKGVA